MLHDEIRLLIASQLADAQHDLEHLRAQQVQLQDELAVIERTVHFRKGQIEALQGLLDKPSLKET